MSAGETTDVPVLRRVTALPSWVWGLVAFAIALAHFATFDFQRAPIQVDIRYFLYFAWRITEGDTPYLDLFDPKTPLSSTVPCVSSMVTPSRKKTKSLAFFDYLVHSRNLLFLMRL